MHCGCFALYENTRRNITDGKTRKEKKNKLNITMLKIHPFYLNCLLNSDMVI